jgi:hypothetical protein
VGATAEEVVGTLVAMAPITGLARVISAIPEFALALGYDLDRRSRSSTENHAGDPGRLR